LADPAPIIHTLMTHPDIVSRYRLDGIVATVDMATGMQTLDRHREAVKQAAMADVLLLTKSDLVTDEHGDALLRRLDALNPAAPRHRVRDGDIEAGKLLDLGLFSAIGKAADVARWLKEEAYAGSALVPVAPLRAAGPRFPLARSRTARAAMARPHDSNRHDDHIHAFCFAIDDPVPDETFAAWLDILMSFVGSNILRVKGILNVVGNPLPVAIHGVQHVFHPPVTLPAWPGADRRSRLVFITHDVGKDVIEQTFRAFRQAAPHAGGVPA
jgi:G3E family GTPase